MDTEILKIGFVGLGRMGSALVSGFLSQGFRPDHVFFVDSNPETAKAATDSLGIVAMDLNTLLQEVDVLFCCIKPQQVSAFMDSVKADLPKETTIVSIAAGVPIDRFQVVHSDQPVIRVMPNTPVMVSEGVSAFASSVQVSEEMESTIVDLLSSVGIVVKVPESQIDAMTGLSGSGPAFVYRMARVMADAILAEGVDSSIARLVAAQTLVGAGEMLLSTDKSPDELIAEVTSPNGTTAAGLEVFDQSTIDQDLTAVVQRAVARAKELSEEL